MHSTDPSYDNRTIASTLKMQIQKVQRLRAQLNASDDPSDGYIYIYIYIIKMLQFHNSLFLQQSLTSAHCRETMSVMEC